MMSLFTVDENLCIKDGFCVAECPAFIIEMKDTDSFPAPVEGTEVRCINCGHCVAVCPHGALSLARMPVKTCPPIDRDLEPTAAQVKQLLRARRSIRTYRDQRVPEDTLRELIEIARYAPTGSNSQCVSWLVVDGRGKLDPLVELAIDWMRHMVTGKDPVAEQYQMAGIVRAWEQGIDIICRGAPALVVTHGPAAYPAMPIDSVIALTYMELAAHSLDLGTCWAGFFMIAASRWPPLADALGLPDGHQAFGAMMVGHPKFPYRRMPERDRAEIAWK